MFYEKFMPITEELMNKGLVFTPESYYSKLIGANYVCYGIFSNMTPIEAQGINLSKEAMNLFSKSNISYEDYVTLPYDFITNGAKVILTVPRSLYENGIALQRFLDRVLREFTHEFRVTVEFSSITNALRCIEATKCEYCNVYKGKNKVYVTQSLMQLPTYVEFGDIVNVKQEQLSKMENLTDCVEDYLLEVL